MPDLSRKLFNNFNYKNEQRLLQGLVSESIAISGETVYYIPRNINDLDPILQEDTQSSYTTAIPVVVQIDSVEGWDQGENSFLSKFGVEIRSKISFSISKEVFEAEVQKVTGKPRPDEGDLIYFPLNNKLFQITFVDKFEMFYPLGSLYSWKMNTELFEYSNETFATGIANIDAISGLSHVADIVDGVPQLMTSENPLTGEQNIQFTKVANTFVSNTETNVFGDIIFDNVPPAD